MSIAFAPSRRLSPIVALGAALALALPAASSRAQAGARRCPTCAPAPERTTSPRGARNAPARRGTPGVVVPLTTASITIGDAQYTGRVDANCSIDERATTSNTRSYYHVLYPWFGYRPPADQPQWRFELGIPRSPRADRFDQFMIHFADGSTRSGSIQKVSYGERMGSGTVRVTRQGAGARFDVDGRTEKGETVRATIVCPAFPKSEAAGG